jgi:hypothetical protein
MGEARGIGAPDRIIRLQGERLDNAYVRRWVAAPGLEDQWQAAQEQSA